MFCDVHLDDHTAQDDSTSVGGALQYMLETFSRVEVTSLRYQSYVIQCYGCKWWKIPLMQPSRLRSSDMVITYTGNDDKYPSVRSVGSALFFSFHTTRVPYLHEILWPILDAEGILWTYEVYTETSQVYYFLFNILVE